MTAYSHASQPTDDRTLYEDQIFGSKERAVHAIKTFWIISGQSFMYQSTKSLLKLKCKPQLKKLKKSKDPYTCVNPIIHQITDSWMLMYKTMNRLLVKAKVSISLIAIQATVTQVADRTPVLQDDVFLREVV